MKWMAGYKHIIDENGEDSSQTDNNKQYKT